MSLPAGGKPKLRGLEHRTDRIALRNQLARRRRGVGGGHSVTCLWGPIQPILDIGTGVGICGAIAWSALPLLTGQAAQNNKKAATPATADQDEGDGVKFGVMTVVGAIPLVNWSAWIFSALEDEELSQVYYLFAALYSLPMLNRGFSQDAFSIATLVLGLLHIQVERFSRTEAVKLDVPSSIRDAASSLQQQFRRASQSSKAQADVQQLEDQPAPAELERDELDESLSRWDERFQQEPKRDQQKERR
ncbi:hypothetical protein WJX84_000937 [Apatococcus fuscideae]|uniref:Uncharacterized protein n=1 Tax=Apatococcus fuscideae TaxID=2026836 RepID=A0AAW1TKU5_9CHLO